MRRLLTLAGCVLVAACGSGESILNAGNPPLPTTTTVPATVPVSTVPGQTTTTTMGSTTTSTPLASLPPCQVGAHANATGPIELTFWFGLQSEIEARLLELTERYHGLQDKVRVTLQNQVGSNETIDKYVQSSQSDRPNLVLLPEFVVQQMADSRTAVPVGACIEESGYDTSQFLPSALGAYQTEGVQWSMPFNMSTPVLFLNKVRFRDAGLDAATPPLSIDDVREQSQAIVDSGAARYGIALDSGVDSGGAWFLEQWFAKAGQPYADNGNGRLAPATRVLFNGPEGVALLTATQSLITDGLAVNVGDNPQSADQLLKLADPAEPAAMAIGSSGAIGVVISALDGGFIEGLTSADLDIGPMPGPDANPLTLVGGGSLYIVADKGDAATAAAWDYVKFLVEAQTQSTWAAGTGYVPVREDALALDPIKGLYETDPRFKVAYDSLKAAPPGDPLALGPVLGPMRQVRSVTASAVAAIFGGADVASTLNAAAQQSDALIIDYNARN